MIHKAFEPEKQVNLAIPNAAFLPPVILNAAPFPCHSRGLSLSIIPNDPLLLSFRTTPFFCHSEHSEESKIAAHKPFTDFRHLALLGLTRDKWQMSTQPTFLQQPRTIETHPIHHRSRKLPYILKTDSSDNCKSVSTSTTESSHMKANPTR